MNKRPIGLERIKLDFLFILAGSVKVEKDFNYDQQRNYFLKKIFGNVQDSNEII